MRAACAAVLAVDSTTLGALIPSAALGMVIGEPLIRIRGHRRAHACDLEQLVLTHVLLRNLLTNELLATTTVEDQFIRPGRRKGLAVSRDAEVRPLISGAYKAEFHS